MELLSLGHMALNGKTTVNDELGRMKKEAIVACFKVLSQMTCL